MKIRKIILVAFVVINQNSIIAQTTGDSLVNSCIPCEELKNIRLPDVTIIETEQIIKPTPHCKVTGIIGTEINFELLLPNKWNSRFVMGGGSGFTGSVWNYAGASIKKGYATVGTDTGHKGHVLEADWALNNMERQVNFGHLAVHRTAVTSKEIIRQYYGSEIAYSYFQGCSRGGGQAMMVAQRFPMDFDGIVAGAPGFTWPASGAKYIQIAQAVFSDQENFGNPVITLENLELLGSFVLEQCDGLDGLNDSIINDPRDCNFDFDQLPICPDDSPAQGCFTLKQLEAIKSVYAGVSDGINIIYPGFPFGCENEEYGWRNWITGPTTSPLALGYPSLQYGLGTEMFKYLVFSDPKWDYSTFQLKDFSKNTKFASSYLDATSTDYSKFRDQGGKMIIYHGWNDHALSALATIDHYELVKKGDAHPENYLRLFLLPGILHCQGGPGPEQVDWLEIVRDWVENDNPPERVVVSKIENEIVTMTRPVFPYPEKAVYNGKGDPKKESSFTTTNNNR